MNARHTWQRVVVARYCGGCNRQLVPGDPMRVTTFVYLDGSPIDRLRCESCAGPAPAALSPVVAPPPIRSLRPWSSFHPTPTPALVLVRADWKTRASNDRDPGEEG